MGTQKQRDAFISAANQLGLSFTRGKPPSGLFDSLNMEGTVGGYRVRVKTMSGNNNNNRTFINVEAPGLPEGLTVKPRTITRNISWARGGVQVGDPAWDDAMYANGRDRRRVLAWLTVDRRRALLQAATREWGPTVFLQRTHPPTLAKQRARVTIPKFPDDAQELIQPIRGMVALLDALELAETYQVAATFEQSPTAAPAMQLPPAATLTGEIVDPFITDSGPSGWSAFGWAMVAAIALLWILGYDGPEDLAWVSIASAVAGLGLVLAVTRR